MEGVIGAAFALGLFGSAHCAVMCGPLALAACGGCGRARAFGAYQAGRLVSYALAGAVLGGAGFVRGLPLARVQGVLALVLAAAALARGVRLIAGVHVSADPARSQSRSTVARSMALLARWMPRKGLGLGLATGALPCGLLAAAWALAATAGSAVTGALAMLAFCAATTPALVAAVVAAGPVRALAASPRLAGVCWCMVAIALGVRPLLQTLGSCH